jgi:hypothetical protein
VKRNPGTIFAVDSRISRSLSSGRATSRGPLAQSGLLALPQDATKKSVERLMGTKPEARLAFIQERPEFADEGALDV